MSSALFSLDIFLKTITNRIAGKQMNIKKIKLFIIIRTVNSEFLISPFKLCGNPKQIVTQMLFVFLYMVNIQI